MSVEIREVGPAQLGSCVQVIRQSFAPVVGKYHISEDACPAHSGFITLERLIFESDNGVEMFCMTETSNDRMVGFVGLDKRESEAVLTHLCVLPELQNRNYGTMLARYALCRCGQLGYRRASVGIPSSDSGLKRFFCRLGFNEETVREFPFLPYSVSYMSYMGSVSSAGNMDCSGDVKDRLV